MGVQGWFREQLQCTDSRAGGRSGHLKRRKSGKERISFLPRRLHSKMLESCRAGFGFSYQSSRASCRSRKLSASLCWDRARLHLDNKTAVYYIRKQGGTRSSVLRGEACLLRKESIQRGIILLNPH